MALKNSQLRHDIMQQAMVLTRQKPIPKARYCEGLEMLPESRNVASAQNHNVNTGEPAAPGMAQVRRPKPKSGNLIGSRKSD